MQKQISLPMLLEVQGLFASTIFIPPLPALLVCHFTWRMGYVHLYSSMSLSPSSSSAATGGCFFNNLPKVKIPEAVPSQQSWGIRTHSVEQKQPEFFFKKKGEQGRKQWLDERTKLVRKCARWRQKGGSEFPGEKTKYGGNDVEEVRRNPCPRGVAPALGRREGSPLPGLQWAFCSLKLFWKKKCFNRCFPQGQPVQIERRDFHVRQVCFPRN